LFGVYRFFSFFKICSFKKNASPVLRTSPIAYGLLPSRLWASVSLL
jgi:hypothetical protein